MTNRSVYKSLVLIRLFWMSVCWCIHNEAGESITYNLASQSTSVVKVETTTYLILFWDSVISFHIPVLIWFLSRRAYDIPIKVQIKVSILHWHSLPLYSSWTCGIRIMFSSHNCPLTLSAHLNKHGSITDDFYCELHARYKVLGAYLPHIPCIHFL